jgi:hypothetical protein
MTQTGDTQVRVVQLPATLSNLANLAALLERVERSPRAPDPAQYRQLIAHVQGELRRTEAVPELKGLLACFPATAELYENMRYDHAGLCLSPLEQAINTEQTARTTLQALRMQPSRKAD